MRCWSRSRTHSPVLRRVPLVAYGFLAISAAMPAAAQPAMRVYATRYYDLNTDLDEAGVQEATLRITLMAEEYAQRTRGFAGAVRERLPFFLFKNRTDYILAGAPPQSAGFFNGRLLAAVNSPDNPERTWQVVQHEGFHQFVHATIGQNLPIWANEGMAEYFGEGVFTGDGFMVGLIPPERQQRIVAKIKASEFKSLRSMLMTTHDLWNSDLTLNNYDQAWSMVHFLAHAENGRYEQPFIGFLKDVSRQTEWERAWKKNMGGDVIAFEQRWKEHWLGLPESASADQYAEAALATVTSFYARAASQRQRFATWEEFEQAAKDGKLKAHAKDALPPRLLTRALEKAPELGTWALADVKSGWKWPMVTTASGAVLEGRFKFAEGRVKGVTVTVKKVSQ